VCVTKVRGACVVVGVCVVSSWAMLLWLGDGSALDILLHAHLVEIIIIEPRRVVYLKDRKEVSELE
jgi:hypothetical protein